MDTILRRFTREGAEQYANALSNGCDLSIGACRVFAEVAKQWNGKRFDKRFTTAVNNALHERFGGVEHNGVTLYNITIHLHEKHYNAMGDELHFTMSLRVRDVQIGDRWVYFDLDIYNDIFVNLTLGNRIDVNVFENAARATAQRVLQTQTHYNEAVRFWDKNVAILNEIDEFIKERIGNVNCLFVSNECKYFTTGKTCRWDSKK